MRTEVQWCRLHLSQTPAAMPFPFEIRIAMPIVFGLVALVVFVVAEWRVKQRGIRAAMTVCSLLVLMAAVWDFKSLEKRWEQHFLLDSTVQLLLAIDAKLERGELARVQQVLHPRVEDATLFHLSREQVEEIRSELSQD